MMPDWQRYFGRLTNGYQEIDMEALRRAVESACAAWPDEKELINNAVLATGVIVVLGTLARASLRGRHSRTICH